METLRVFFKDKVSVQELRACLDLSSYRAIANEHEVYGWELLVFFEYKNEETYIRWIAGDAQSDYSNISRINTLGFNFQAVYTIRYSFNTLSTLIPIFSIILNCWEGLVECEDRFFDHQNIHNLKDVKLPPIDYAD